MFIRRVRTCRRGDTSAEEDVAYAAPLRPRVGERRRSPRLWQRSGSGPTWTRGDLGRVAQGLASSTAIKVWRETEEEEVEEEDEEEGGGGGGRGRRESLTGATQSGGLLCYYGNKPPLHQSRQFVFFLAVHPTAMAGRELALESGSNKPVIKQNSESHYSPHVHLGGRLFINYYQSGGRASELLSPTDNQHVVVLFLMSEMSLFISNGDLDNICASSFLLKLRK